MSNIKSTTLSYSEYLKVTAPKSKVNNASVLNNISTLVNKTYHTISKDIKEVNNKVDSLQADQELS